LLAAEKDGICMDELFEGLKQLSWGDSMHKLDITLLILLMLSIILGGCLYGELGMIIAMISYALILVIITAIISRFNRWFILIQKKKIN
jgi:hypothetical protein